MNVFHCEFETDYKENFYFNIEYKRQANKARECGRKLSEVEIVVLSRKEVNKYQETERKAVMRGESDPAIGKQVYIQPY